MRPRLLPQLNNLLGKISNGDNAECNNLKSLGRRKKGKGMMMTMSRHQQVCSNIIFIATWY